MGFHFRRPPYLADLQEAEKLDKLYGEILYKVEHGCIFDPWPPDPLPP